MSKPFWFGWFIQTTNDAKSHNIFRSQLNPFNSYGDIEFQKFTSWAYQDFWMVKIILGNSSRARCAPNQKNFCARQMNIFIPRNDRYQNAIYLDPKNHFFQKSYLEK